MYIFAAQQCYMMYSSELIHETVHHLQNGHIILYPTDTIWGLGCNAMDATAIKKINAIKGRTADKNLILLCNGIEMLESYIPYIPPKARNLIAYHTRPLTIIYQNPVGLPNELIAEDNSIAIRIVKDPFCEELIGSFGFPIVSTSANFSGNQHPNAFSEIDPKLIELVDHVVPYRKEEAVQTMKPSTIVKVLDDQDLIFIRE